MKSNATMYRIAKALVVEEGPRTWKSPTGKIYAGYYLTREELRGVFGREGFNVYSSQTWINRISAWAYFGQIVPVGTTIFWTFGDTISRLAVEKIGNDAGADEIIV